MEFDIKAFNLGMDYALVVLTASQLFTALIKEVTESSTRYRLQLLASLSSLGGGLYGIKNINSYEPHDVSFLLGFGLIELFGFFALMYFYKTKPFSITNVGSYLLAIISGFAGWFEIILQVIIFQEIEDYTLVEQIFDVIDLYSWVFHVEAVMLLSATTIGLCYGSSNKKNPVIYPGTGTTRPNIEPEIEASIEGLFTFYAVFGFLALFSSVIKFAKLD